MREKTATVKYAAIGSSALVLPLLMLELINRPITEASVKGLVVLFGILWLVPALSVITAAPVVRQVRGGGTANMGAVNLTARVLVVAALVFFWGGLVADQMPCFLGVPNCD